mmetsp:Transcript_543/g.1067  ORF Transcript_543/g.1067 Transcript_543/m.1067 type:complete len:328 (+) Transcript_543:1621-2604(+)
MWVHARGPHALLALNSNAGSMQVSRHLDKALLQFQEALRLPPTSAAQGRFWGRLEAGTHLLQHLPELLGFLVVLVRHLLFDDVFVLLARQLHAPPLWLDVEVEVQTVHLVPEVLHGVALLPGGVCVGAAAAQPGDGDQEERQQHEPVQYEEGEEVPHHPVIPRHHHDDAEKHREQSKDPGHAGRVLAADEPQIRHIVMKEVEGREGQRDQHVPDQEAQHHLAVHAVHERIGDLTYTSNPREAVEPDPGLLGPLLDPLRVLWLLLLRLGERRFRLRRRVGRRVLLHIFRLRLLRGHTWRSWPARHGGRQRRSLAGASGLTADPGKMYG